MALLFRRNTEMVNKIYDDFINEKLIVDQTYQRRKVWMPQDKVRLIETILLDLVMPEVFFWQAKIVAETGETLTHIVDGQQRIVSIVEFISGEFLLSDKFLMDSEIKDRCGNKCFSELTNEDKERVWQYNIAIVNIDKAFEIDKIKQMFYRLNLTNYNLNLQEKLNSVESVFGEKSEALSNLDFWKECKVFSAADARRMQDIRFCCSVYILANEGIVDQTNNKKIDDYYYDFAENFDLDKTLYKKIESAMDVINTFRDKTTSGFIAKKAQMYTLFCLAFKMIDNQIPSSPEIFERFKLFVKAYNQFRNEFSISFKDEKLRKINEDIKKYKLASSEGVNKLKNRVIRLEILYKLCVEGDANIKDQLKNLEALYLEQTASGEVAFEEFDAEDLTDISEVNVEE